MKDRIQDWKEIADYLRKSNQTYLVNASPCEINFVYAGPRQAMKIWFDDQVKDYILIHSNGSHGKGSSDWRALMAGYKSIPNAPSTDIEYNEGEETGFRL